MSYRQLTADEEKLENTVVYHWELFLSQMQDSSEYINTQTPITVKSIEELYEVVYSYAVAVETVKHCISWIILKSTIRFSYFVES